jgi:hypothetical protein
MPDPGSLVIERLAEVASLLDGGSVHETLQRIVDLAVKTIPDCEHAGVSLVHHRKIATLAATALGAAQTEEGLHIALRSRYVIGQAKGILMERHRITDGQAFEMLKRASQRLNVRLAGVAEGVARTGESPATD